MLQKSAQDTCRDRTPAAPVGSSGGGSQEGPGELAEGGCGISKTMLNGRRPALEGPTALGVHSVGSDCEPEAGGLWKRPQGL